MFYFIFGDNFLAKQAFVEKLSVQLGLPREDFWDEELALEEIITGKDLFSSLEEAKMLVFHNCQSWREAKTNWQFLATHSELASESTICFVMDKKPLVLKKLPRKAFKAVEFALPSKAWEVSKWLDQQLEDVGLKLDSASKKLLLERNPTAEALISEIQKLTIVGQNLSPERIAKMITGEEGKGDYFQFLDFFVQGDKKKTLTQFRQLVTGGDEPIGILARLSKQLCLLRSLQEKVVPEKIHPFALKKAQAQAKQVPRDARYWSQTLSSLLDLDVKLRSGRSPEPALDMETVLVHCVEFSESGKAKKA